MGSGTVVEAGIQCTVHTMLGGAEWEKPWKNNAVTVFGRHVEWRENLQTRINGIKQLAGGFDRVGASSDTLVIKFEKTAFESEHGGHPGSVYRWEVPVRLYVDGPQAAAHADYVADLAVSLCRLSGRDVTLLREWPSNDASLPNFAVMLGSADALESRLADVPAVRDFMQARNPYGYAIVGGDGRAISVVLAAVRDDRPDHEVRATLLEEISQGFGLMNDTDIVHPSVWTLSGPNFESLPLNDQIILRVLYDPAITPGMPKDEAMSVARRIIPDLVRAARRGGEAVLYQRDDCPP